MRTVLKTDVAYQLYNLDWKVKNAHGRAQKAVGSPTVSDNLVTCGAVNTLLLHTRKSTGVVDFFYWTMKTLLRSLLLRILQLPS